MFFEKRLIRLTATQGKPPMTHMKKPALLAAILAATAFASLGSAQAQQAAPGDDTAGQSELGPRQEAAKPDRRPLQLPVPEQHQLQRRTAQRHAGHPQRPAGDPDPRQRGLERHHAHHPAADLAAVSCRRRTPCRSAPAPPLSPRSCRRATRPTAGCGASARSIQIPTISDKTLGSSVWGGGPTGVLVYMKGPWVAGVLANNVWSFGGTSGRFGTSYNMFPDAALRELQFRRRLVCHQPPIITANWPSPGTILDGAGRRRRRAGDQDFGKLPVNLSLGAYYNVVGRNTAPTWHLRTQVTFIF